jgi:hypothetical protein
MDPRNTNMFTQQSAKLYVGPYEVWLGTGENPDAPAGGGGPGFFRSAVPLGLDISPFGEFTTSDSLAEGKSTPLLKLLSTSASARGTGAIDAVTVQEVKLTAEQYAEALSMVFPQQYFDDVLRLVDRIGQLVAQRIVQDFSFRQACQRGNWRLAGTKFHAAAAKEGAAMAHSLPPGYTMTFENTVQAGKGGSRIDILVETPIGTFVEIDWKTSGRSALASGSREEMARHERHIETRLGAPVYRQESKSWMDYVRPKLPGIKWPR